MVSRAGLGDGLAKLLLGHRVAAAFRAAVVLLKSLKNDPRISTLRFPWVFLKYYLLLCHLPLCGGWGQDGLGGGC